MQHTLVYYPTYPPQPTTQRTSAAHPQPHVSQAAPNMNANVAQQQQHQQHVNMQSEYYSQMEMIPSALLAGTPQMPSVPKSLNKSGSRAIPIINPDTGINVVEELRKETAISVVASGGTSAAIPTVTATPVKPPQIVAPIAIVPQVAPQIIQQQQQQHQQPQQQQQQQVTAPPKVEQEQSVDKIKLSAKVEEKVEVEKVVQKVDNTPVVSANSEGPSVDITPKHNNKIKKM